MYFLRMDNHKIYSHGDSIFSSLPAGYKMFFFIWLMSSIEIRWDLFSSFLLLFTSRESYLLSRLLEKKLVGIVSQIAQRVGSTKI
jgi:hypothetical protein